MYTNNLHSGTATVTITGKGNYSGSIVRTFAITARPLTLTSQTPASRAYDGTALSSSGIGALRADNLAPGDALYSVSFTGTQTDAGSSANTFVSPVLHNADGADVTADYSITKQYGTLTITPAADTITVTQDVGKVYDGAAAAAPAYTRKGTGAVSITYYTEAAGVYTPLATAPKAAGTYYLRYTEAAAGNYQQSYSVYTRFIITPRPVTVTATDAGSSYGSVPAALSASITTGTLAAGDDLAIGASCAATAASPTGQYAIVPVYTDNPNYIVTAVNGIYTVSAADLPYTASGYTGIYDKAAHTGSIATSQAGAAIYYGTKQTITAANYTDTAVSGTVCPSFTDAAAAPYTVYFYIRTANFKDVSGSFTVSIGKAPQNVALPAAASLVYDGGTHPVTATTTGDGTLRCTWYQGTGSTKAELAGLPSTAGTYTITASAAETNNYLAGSAETTLTITQRPLTVTADSAVRTYNGSALTANGGTITAGTLASGDTLASVTANGTQTHTGESVNTAVSAVIRSAGGDDVSASYALTLLPGKLTVQQAAGAVTLTSSSAALGKEYDGTAAVLPQYTQTGNGAVSFVYYRAGASGNVLLPQAPTDAGSYFVEARTAETQDYSAAQSALLAYAITPRPITIRADDVTASYGFTTAALHTSVTLGSLIGSDDLHLGAATSVTAATPVGVYDITPTYTADPNYTVTAINGAYTVTAAAIPYTAGDYTGIYDGKSHTAPVSTAISGAQIYYSTKQAVTDANCTDPTVAGTVCPAFTDAGRYEVYFLIKAPNRNSVSGKAVVYLGKLTPAITGSDLTAAYDGTAHSIVAAANGDGTLSYSKENGQTVPGTYTVTVTSAATANCLKATRYFTLTVTPRDIVFTAASKSQPYSGSALTSAAMPFPARTSPQAIP